MKHKHTRQEPKLAHTNHNLGHKPDWILVIEELSYTDTVAALIECNVQLSHYGDNALLEIKATKLANKAERLIKHKATCLSKKQVRDFNRRVLSLLLAKHDNAPIDDYRGMKFQTVLALCKRKGIIL